MYAYRWREADESFRRAVAADPGFAPSGYIYGLYLLRVGRITEAEEPIRRARNADPLSGTASQMLAYVLSLLGRYDESLAESRRAYELDSSLAVMHSVLAAIVLADGRPDEARALARARLGLPFNGIAAYVLGATGDRAAAARNGARVGVTTARRVARGEGSQLRLPRARRHRACPDRARGVCARWRGTDHSARGSNVRPGAAKRTLRGGREALRAGRATLDLAQGRSSTLACAGRGRHWLVRRSRSSPSSSAW